VARLQGVSGNALLARRLQRDPDPAAPAAAPGAPAAPTATPAAGCIVDDAVETLEPHQQRRSQALAALRAASSAAAEAALGGSPWAAAARGRVTTELETLFATYAAQDSVTLERTLRAVSPVATAATSATAIVGAVAAEVGRGVKEALPAEDPLAAEAAGPVTGIASAVAKLLFKRRRGSRNPAADPLGTLQRLGRGESFGGSARGRMEQAFGADFSDVRVHTDATAAGLAQSTDARAFSIGRSIAFGAGEYQPGTLEGDALIAHELAHVVQQRGAAGGAVAARAPSDDVAGLEADADSAAIDATVGLWLQTKGSFSNLRRKAGPALTSGIALRSCSSKKPEIQKRAPEIGTSPGEIGGHITGGMSAISKGASPDKGLHYWFSYRDSYPDKFDPKWRFGYTTSQRFNSALPRPFTWGIKIGEKPSVALTEWLTGLTIADCASVAVALQFDAIRASLGDEAFDKLFTPDNPFFINQFPNMNPGLSSYISDTKGKEFVKGDLLYFKSHKHYKHKHPAGAWSGENAVYMGDGLWSGFGVKPVSQDVMMQTILDQYNESPDTDDDTELKAITGKKGKIERSDYGFGRVIDGLPFKEKYDTMEEFKKGGAGPETSALRVDPSKFPKAPPK
jgi:hypothetical protein